MSSFRKYIAVFIPNVIIAVLFLRWYAMQFLYRTLEDYMPGLPTTMGATIIIAIITIIIVRKITFPFDKLLKKVKAGYEPSDDERVMSLKIANKVNLVTVGACLLGFFIGQAIVLGIEIATGVREYHFLRVVITMFQAISIGTVCALSMIFSFVELITPYKTVLKIHDIEPFLKYKSMNIDKKVMIMVTASMIMLAVNTLSVSFEIINVQETQPVQNALSYYLGWGVVSTILSMSFSAAPLWLILQGYKKRINNSSQFLSDIAAKGDMVSRIDITVIDDVGELVHIINVHMEEFGNMLKNMQEKTDVVGKSAGVLSMVVSNASFALTGMDDTRCKINEECNRQNKLILAADKDVHSLYQGIRTVEKHVHEQSSSVQQSSASITQMAANIASVADMTKKADVVSDELSSTTEKGNNSITKAIKSILEIQKSSVEVQEIVKVIQKIASQTNLLSMNAAIEAAHAGEFGAGFAVVADEVRTLAASSAKSAKDIQLHIRSMVDKIDGGVQAIEEAGDAFKMIAENVEKNSSLIQTISRAMEEQEVGAKETMDATAEMVEATQAIHELVEKQSEYADNIKSMMETVVNSAEQVSGAVEENQNAGDNIVLSIRQVEETVNKNSNAVEIMQKSIQKYQI
ncbi:MAG: hypothetical protein GX220_04740 [Treponema sp.]|nr:hypothetical protein [Treponema sp.]